jgi:predicted HicB family RNase H-like nuclease
MEAPEKPVQSAVIIVRVPLTPKDHEAASAAALQNNEAIEEWIATLVNMALKP